MTLPVSRSSMNPSLKSRVARAAGFRPVHCRRVVGGGYTPAERWIATGSGGESAFVKVGVTPLTADFLRDEMLRYRWLRGEFMPALRGFDDDGRSPVLVIEDLSHGRWPPPWQAGDFERLPSAMRRVASARPLPAELPELEAMRSELSGWSEVARDASSFLALELCTPGWLERALPELLEAQSRAVLTGNSLVHADLRSDNLCLLAERVVLVDWNFGCRGNARFDLCAAAPSIQFEGGPPPEALVGHEPTLAALVAGFFAARAGLPPIADAPRVRWIQLEQLRFALPWAVRALALPALDGPPLGE